MADEFYPCQCGADFPSRDELRKHQEMLGCPEYMFGVTEVTFNCSVEGCTSTMQYKFSEPVIVEDDGDWVCPAHRGTYTYSEPI